MLCMFLMSSMIDYVQSSVKSEKSNEFDNQRIYCKLGKIKKQVLILYPNNQFAYYQLSASNKTLFDTGSYKHLALLNRLQFSSLKSRAVQNPLFKNPVKINKTEVYIPKEKIVFKQSSLAEVADFISFFDKQKTFEFKTSPLDLISKKRGYKIEYISSTSSYSSKIRVPESNTNVYNKGQKKADSLYSIELKKGKNKDYQAVYDLAKSIVQNSKTDSAKLRLLCDWMTTNFEYLLEGTVNPAELIKTKATRCEGYANFILELCKEANIPCIKVIGPADNNSLKRYDFSKISGLHAWNLVKIQGLWRPIDVTWLDPTWPKDYKKENRVYGNEHYFNPNLDRFSMDHMPDIPELALTNYSPLGHQAFIENPVIEQDGYSLQYVGSLTNRIYTKNPSFTIEFYATEAQTITIKRGKNESNIEVLLKPGINEIVLASPSSISEYIFENKNIKAVFHVNPGKSNLIAINESLNKVKSYNWSYQIEFFEYMIKIAKSSQFEIKNNSDSTGKINSLAKTIIDQYEGQLPVCAWQLTWNPQKGKASPVAMRFYFTEELVNSKGLFVECDVACKFEETSMHNAKKFPCSNWHLGLE